MLTLFAGIPSQSIQELKSAISSLGLTVETDSSWREDCGSRKTVRQGSGFDETILESHAQLAKVSPTLRRPTATGSRQLKITDFPPLWTFGNGVSLGAWLNLSYEHRIQLSYVVFNDSEADLVEASFDLLKELMES